MSTIRIAVAAVLFVLVALGSAITAPAEGESFDPPLTHRVVDLGRLPGSKSHGRLTCDTFGTFMVKELDLGGEGAEWFAIVPARAGQEPACTRARSRAEKRIRAQDWCGYFAGAKADYVFLNACGFHNAGLDFAVYDARTGTRVFEDTAMGPGAGAVQFRRGADGALQLSYARVALFNCTLPTEKAACWDRIRRTTGVAQTDIPACTTYEKNMTGTVVSYPVEVALQEKPSRHAVDGEIRCWPPE